MRDPKKDTPTLNALWDVSPMSASQALNFAPSLLQMIDGAKVVGDRVETVQGEPGHLLVLDLPPPKQASGVIEIGSVTIEKDRLTLWLGVDSLPVSAERIRVTKASALIFKVAGRQTEKWTFRKENDRLLRMHYESSGSGSGLGQTSTGSVIATLIPHR